MDMISLCDFSCLYLVVLVWVILANFDRLFWSDFSPTSSYVSCSS